MTSSSRKQTSDEVRDSDSYRGCNGCTRQLNSVGIRAYLQSMLSGQHRLLGEDSRHCALRRCLGYRGQEGRGEIARGVDTGHAGLAALVYLKGDAGGRLHRGEAQ